MKTAMSKMKRSPGGFNSRVDIAEEQISQLGDIDRNFPKRNIEQKDNCDNNLKEGQSLGEL